MNCGRNAVKKAIVFGIGHRDEKTARRKNMAARLDGLDRRTGVAPGLDAEPDQISRARPAHDLEQVATTC